MTRMKEPTEVTRTILHTRFILITSSTAGFMALSGRRTERKDLALRRAAPRPPAALRGAGEGGAGGAGAAAAAAPEDARAPAPRTGGR